MEKNSIGRSILEVVEIVVIALILSWVLRTFVVEARVIPTGSMLNTIQLQDRIVVDKLFFKWSEIKRGDIVVFHPPERAGSKDDFIKRVIGLPGETIEIKNQKVYINDKPLDESYILEKPRYTYGPQTIPDNQYFVMGDNRNNSADSHEWGMLPAGNITGRTLFRYWPLDRFGLLAR
ncbi:MAG TPA: signal peptidase I [Verrucomicrobiae bacterium]|nr:signal peptidase I [Verrucomicrobiae bacterium]